MGNKKKTYSCPLYGIKYVLFKVKKDFERATSTTIPDYLAGLVTGSHVWIGPEHRDPNTIFHEAYHLTCRILDHVGVNWKEDEEAFAYLIGEVGEKMLLFYSDRGENEDSSKGAVPSE